MAEIEIALRGVSERDIDHLLVEELASAAEFKEWFAAQLGLPAGSRVLSVARSVLTATGESDLEVVLQSDEMLTKVLIENKIDAPLQPDQAERYRQRASEYLSNHPNCTVLTALVAPENYSEGLVGFDARVSYEDMRDWFTVRSGTEPRARYKAALLNQALERSETGWSSVPSPATTGFWQDYWQFAWRTAPELQMPAPGSKPATSGFIRFKPAALMPGVQLIHKVPYGNVDLQFAGMGSRIQELDRQFGARLEQAMQLVPAGKSAVVRISVEPASVEAPFDEHLARGALDAASRLLAWYKATLSPARVGIPSGPDHGGLPEAAGDAAPGDPRCSDCSSPQGGGATPS